MLDSRGGRGGRWETGDDNGACKEEGRWLLPGTEPSSSGCVGDNVRTVAFASTTALLVSGCACRRVDVSSLEFARGELARGRFRAASGIIDMCLGGREGDVALGLLYKSYTNTKEQALNHVKNNNNNLPERQHLDTATYAGSCSEEKEGCSPVQQEAILFAEQVILVALGPYGKASAGSALEMDFEGYQILQWQPAMVRVAVDESGLALAAMEAALEDS